jgi:hypothetical protein
MTLPTIGCARSVRDGGIDAMAALNEALREAIVGLSPQDQQALQLTFGQVMGEIIEKTAQAFPELEPSQDTWATVAKARAAARANAA